MRREHRTPATVVDQRGTALVEGGGADLSPTQRPILIGALASTDRFHRDTGLGNILHPGKISFREVSAVDSLHVIIDGNRVSAHVDDISPLRRRRDGSIGYSLPRILAHNVTGVLADVNRILRGAQGEHRCNLDCEVVWVDDDHPADSAVPHPCGAGTDSTPAPDAPTTSDT
jgi:hypothetical protein